ncbi:MAG: DUF3276 family protein [Paludibacteraceae bacterium]|nr:DUF3276 family protein [Paludibacteraceae bacterium]
MEHSTNDKREQEIVFSRAIKTGKRIYYLDVKRTRTDDLFLAITESKKRVTGTDENVQVTFEKHKIFLYREDFEKFTVALQDVIDFVRQALPEDEVKLAPTDITDEPTDKEEETPRSKFDFHMDFDM